MSTHLTLNFGKTAITVSNDDKKLYYDDINSCEWTFKIWNLLLLSITMPTKFTYVHYKELYIITQCNTFVYKLITMH